MGAKVELDASIFRVFGRAASMPSAESWPDMQGILQFLFFSFSFFLFLACLLMHGIRVPQSMCVLYCAYTHAFPNIGGRTCLSFPSI